MAAEDEISGIQSAIARLERAQGALEADSRELADTLATSIAEIREFRARFEGFVERDERIQNLLIAHIRMVSVRQDLETRFGHYNEIRRLANGMLLAMDAGTVRNETAQNLSEEKMLTAPGYWLASSLVGLAAWIRDDRMLADRALSRALWMDNEKTSLFYALVLARQRRDNAAARWLRQAVKGQDPRSLPPEFAVMLDAAVSDVLGPAARWFAIDRMASWFERLADDSNSVVDQQDRWRRFLLSKQRSIGSEFVALPKISSTWQTLVSAYQEATVFAPVEQHFRQILEGEPDERLDLKGQVDDILKNLVSKFDDEESEYHEQIAQLLAMIRAQGDEEVAEFAQVESALSRGEAVDFLTLITDAAVNSQHIVSNETQRLSLLLARGWILPAVRELAAANRSRMPDGVDLEIGPWAGRIDSQATPEQLIRSARRAIRSATAKSISDVRFGLQGFGAALSGCIFLIVGAAAAVGRFSVTLIVALVLLGLTSVVYTIVHYRRLRPRRDRLRRAGDELCDVAQDDIAQAFEEFVHWRQQWEGEIANAQGLQHYLEKLPEVAEVIERGLEHPQVASRPTLLQGDPDLDPDVDRSVVHRASPKQRPNQDSSGRPVALRPPDWNLLPPPVELG